jgi:plasmid maintenance system antidote protein VapI
MTTKSIPTMTDVLRQTIAECGLPFKRLEKETGVTRQSIMGFVKGERTIRLDMADKLATYFGLQLVKRKGR